MPAPERSHKRKWRLRIRRMMQLGNNLCQGLFATFLAIMGAKTQIQCCEFTWERDCELGLPSVDSACL